MNAPAHKPCLIFAPLFWKNNREVMEHPFTDEQIDQAVDGVIGEWAGAICLVSRKLDDDSGYSFTPPTELGWFHSVPKKIL